MKDRPIERPIENFRFPKICSFESCTVLHRDQSLDSWNLDEDPGRQMGSVSHQDDAGMMTRDDPWPFVVGPM